MIFVKVHNLSCICIFTFYIIYKKYLSNRKLSIETQNEILGDKSTIPKHECFHLDFKSFQLNFHK